MNEKYSAESVINYTLERLKDIPKLADAASFFGYSRNYFDRVFKKSFGMPYTRFVTMLVLREAAYDLRDGHGIHETAVRYGYATSYQFSRAFKREIGMSPRSFINSGAKVPDVPPRKTVNGHNMYLSYVITDDITVYGEPVPAEHGINTDLLKECAYHLDHDDPRFRLHKGKDTLAFWWGDSPDEICYVLSAFYIPGVNAPEGMRSFVIPGSNYAVFSIERTGNDREDLAAHREMVRYAMKDWVRINQKKADRMYYTYEVFNQSYTYLFIPLIEDQSQQVQMSRSEDLDIDHWISYIEENIRNDLNVRDIAAHFHYSETHFRRTFKMYFEMSPQEYIRKRRLYLAAEAFHDAHSITERKNISRMYYFHTPEFFRRLFISEFGVGPEDYRKVNVDVTDLADYYEDSKDKVSVAFTEEPEFTIGGIVLQSQSDAESVENKAKAADEDKDFDIPELAAYWMTHDPDDVAGTSYAAQGSEAKVKAAIWDSENEAGTVDYLLGYVMMPGEDLPERYRKIHVKGGRYAVFESMNVSDADVLADTYRMLARLSFYGWIKENRYRVDFSRLTYVKYYSNKLHFYIPTHE